MNSGSVGRTQRRGGFKKNKNWLAAERRERGGFAALPHCLLESQVYVHLSAHAVKLLVDLLAQFKGFNNGDLCMAWTIMKPRGWKSRDTLNKARLELLACELIIVSRYGDRRRPHLYALTFFAIDECGGKLDIKATATPGSEWRKYEPLTLLQVKSTPTLGEPKPLDTVRPPGDRTIDHNKYGTPSVSNPPVLQ